MKKMIGLILLTVVLLALPISAMAGCQCVQPTYGGQTDFEDATCTKDGYYVLECAVCGGEYRVKAENALGHDYQYAMTNPALCESDGKEWYECTRCGDTQYQTIPKLGHQWSLAGSLNATCAQDGANYYECTRLGCGEERTETIKSAASTIKAIKDGTIDESQAAATVDAINAMELGDRTEWIAKADAALASVK